MARSEQPPRKLGRWQAILLLIVFWALPGLLFGMQTFFMYRWEDREIDLTKVVGWQVAGWLFWVAGMPVVIRLGRRFPLARRHWARPAAIHLGFAVLVTLLFAAWNTAMTYLLAPAPYDSWPVLPTYGMWILNRFHLVLLIYGGILGIAYGLDYYRKYQERELQASQLEAQLAQSQLQALKMQLHPHFLFNTMNAIAMLVRKRENDAAVRMLAGLSDLLRMALENEGQQEVSLEQELEFLGRYLELEQIRFHDRLNVTLEIAPETRIASIPNLILQPLVENAIRHGIGADAASGILSIHACRKDGQLHIEVRDDGKGFDAAKKPVEGVGLSNTRNRLQRLYGERQRLVLTRGEPKGTVATLLIPFRRAAMPAGG